MGWIDVAIPGAIGLLLALAPRLFIKARENTVASAAKERKIRGLGLLLLVVACVYAAIKFASAR
jgi:hypothetical protein